METVNTRRPSRTKTASLWILAVFLIMAAGCFAAYYWIYLMPSKEHEKPDYNGIAKPLFYKGKMLEMAAAGQKDSLKLPYSIIKSTIDPNIHYEQASESVIITTQDKVVRFKTSQLTAMMNEKPFQLTFPAEKVSGELYVPVEPLEQLYGIELREDADTGIVTLFKQGDIVRWGKSAAYPNKPDKTVALRKDAHIKSPIYADVKQADKLIIWEEKNGWYYVQLTSGITGFMRKEDVELGDTETIPLGETKSPYVPWKPTGGKLNVTWEQVTTKNPDTSKIGPMPGLNVISPTWFELTDGQGNLKNLADPAYVKWAHSQNYQVWALFSNGFDPKRTTEALASYDSRIKMIKQLLSYAQLYSLQGINIDFENVSLQDKDELVQFVREMVPLMHEQGLVVSMDVTVKSTNENWSMFLDRKALIQSLDYMMVMAYDEYWASSPKSGSVASLPWVERSIVQLMKEDNIPPSKLVLGIPFYTRVWTEETKDGKPSVSSRAVFMDTAQQTVKDKKLTPKFLEEAGQNYVEYKDGAKTIKIWLEDETSVKARIELVKKYDLAGVASWRRGYETPQMWPLIQSILEKRP